MPKRRVAKDSPSKAKRAPALHARAVSARAWVLAATIALAVFLAYSKAWNAGFVWDDDFHLTKNPSIVGNLGFRSIWLTSAAIYYPLTLTTFWVAHALWGLAPAPYHLLNILVHAGCAVLLWRVLVMLEVRAAWLGAAVWALHPVQVESVAWVTELKNTQSCLFYLGSILLFVTWRFRREEDSDWWRYALALVCAGCAILSKSSTVMLPVILALCLWWKDGRWKWRNIVALIPFFLMSALAGAWTIWEQHHDAKAAGSEWTQSWAERGIIAGSDVWFYLGKLFWPRPLMFIYPRWTVDASRIVSWLPAVGLLVIAAVFWRYRKSWGRAPFFAGAYFLVSLFPVLDFFNVYFFRYSFVADHFQYLASVGPLVFAGVALWRVFDFTGENISAVRPIACAALVVLLGSLSWRQTRIFQSPDALWNDTIEKNPAAWMAYNNYAMLALQEGRAEEALARYRRALELDSTKYEIHLNFGSALLDRGQVEEALSQLREALALAPNEPLVHYNLGRANLRSGRLSESAAELERVVQLDPEYVPAYSDLGLVYLSQGRSEESLNFLQKAVALDPSFASARFNLANTLLQLRRPDEALAQLEEALKRNPNDPEAQKNLAWILATSPETRIRDGERAVALAEKANRLTGGTNPVIAVTLAAAYAENGRFPDAIQTAERAMQSAEAAGNFALANGIRQYLDVYQSGRPFRDVR